jgi:hypothetical protein
VRAALRRRERAPPFLPLSAADDTVLDAATKVTWVAGTNTIVQSNPAVNPR